MMRIDLRNILVQAIIFGGLISLGIASPASATSFNAGRIIDDGVFTDKTTMSASQIQDFLNAKIAKCDTWGEQPYAGTTRAQYAASRGVSTPFICLKDYTQDGKRASQIIYDVAQKYSINPQVLIVLLQKEQGLITDDWPWPIQYRSATGYGCPDTADCSTQYYGFTNQVDWAARMFRAILNDSPDWYTPYELGNNYIQYSPDASCGGSTVNIQNRATQALYNYTPYQPNQAALDAGWGTAYCGAYGNRNFHLYFTSWFGASYQPFVSMDIPRWMAVNKDSTYKYNMFTNQTTEGPFSNGTHILGNSKITVDGSTYIRTNHDTYNNQPQGIKLTDLSEIPYEPMQYPRWMEMTQDGFKTIPRFNGKSVDSKLLSGRTILFDSKTTVNGTVYLRTAHDTMFGNDKAISLGILKDVEFEYMVSPRWMKTTAEDTKRVNPTTGDTIDTVPKATQIKFDSKLTLAHTTYLRSANDTSSNSWIAINSNELEENKYIPMVIPRTMTVTRQTTKYDMRTLEIVDSSISLDVGREISFKSKIFVNDQWYLRTAIDSDNNLPFGVPLSSLSD